MNNSKKNTVREIVLQLEEENRIEYEISHRGGTYGAYASIVIDALFPTLMPLKCTEIASLLPRKVGVNCNYLGGGIRGTINRSDYSKELPAKYAKRIDSFTRECKRRYEEIENGAGLNDEEYPDGDKNWDALATKGLRDAGIESAY